jgi:hypothetical protein
MEFFRVYSLSVYMVSVVCGWLGGDCRVIVAVIVEIVSLLRCSLRNLSKGV